MKIENNFIVLHPPMTRQNRTSQCD